MTYPDLSALSDDLRQRMAAIRLVAFDVDGTLTDGSLARDDLGQETKAFHVHDGLGLKLLMDRRIVVALVTARTSPVVAARAAELGIEELHQGVTDKAGCLREMAERHALSLAQCAFMGDDLPDLPALRAAGLSCAPGNAHPWIAERVQWQTRASGGQGAAREFCDLLLAAGGHLDDLLTPGVGA
jgi:3-deoxy-D-manno-octulosonate 8-phosphate phosphatase (KDO 8-P phosphatase)